MSLVNIYFSLDSALEDVDHSEEKMSVEHERAHDVSDMKMNHADLEKFLVESVGISLYEDCIKVNDYGLLIDCLGRDMYIIFSSRITFL